MPQFKVSFEDVGFTAGSYDDGQATAPDLKRAWEKALKSADCEGFEGLQEVTWSADDSVFEGGKDEDGDVKAFVSITLLVEAETEDDAYATEPPEEILNVIREDMLPDLDMEGNWETVSADPIAGQAPSP